MKSLIIFILSLILLTGCQTFQEVNKPSDRELAQRRVEDEINNPRGYSIAGSGKDEASYEAMRTMPRFSAEFNKGNYGNDWHIPHKTFTHYLDSIKSERYLFFHAQILSCKMLDKYLLRQPKVNRLLFTVPATVWQ